MASVTDHSLAFFTNRPAHLPPEEERRLFVRRATAWGLVALVHTVLLLVLVITQREDALRLGKRETETILDLGRAAPLGSAPPIDMIRPIFPTVRPPEAIVPPIIVIPPPKADDQSAPKTPADVLKAIGEALSCGAENYENLTQTERSRCKTQPWIARKLPDGSIVMQAQNIAPVVPSIPKISGADALRRQQQTSTCPPGAYCPPTMPLFSIPTN